jgi:hypothetical protein
MSILKEINDSNEFIKAKAINLFLLPFWYVSIFLFNYEFYSKSDSLIIIAMCIVITLTSTFSLSLIIEKLNIINGDNTEDDNYLYHSSISVILLIIWLSILIVLFYSLGFLFNVYIYFYWYLVIYSTPIFLIFLVTLIYRNRKNKHTHLKK